MQFNQLQNGLYEQSNTRRGPGITMLEILAKLTGKRTTAKPEIKRKYPTMHATCIVAPNASAAHFITHEGMNRAITEIPRDMV